MNKIHYNSPVVLTFAICCAFVLVLSLFIGRINTVFFCTPAEFLIANPVHYFRLISHVFGHANYQHLTSNMMMILLLGPILEEKYGSRRLFTMMFATALFTGLINVLLFDTRLLGASGIAFMFIILASIVNMRKDSLPLTFVLVFSIFIGNEFHRAVQPNNISETAHIAGGALGALFGFCIRRK